MDILLFDVNKLYQLKTGYKFVLFLKQTEM